jgi:hypothetical protein
MTIVTDAAPRRIERLSIFEPVHIRQPEPLLAQAVDLSAGGIGLRARKSLSPDTEVALQLFDGQVEFLGTAKWVRPLGSGFRIGVQFHTRAPELVERLHALRNKR